MDDLDRLANELRLELGEPPDELPGARRARLASKPSRSHSRSRAGVLVGAVCLVGAWALWSLVPREPRAPSPARPPSVRLAAETTRGPYRLADGSVIDLAPGARGRLSASGEGSHFELHAGKATFDVRHRANQRWGVAAGPVEVDVVGTRFSVEIGPRERVEVCVERGSVAVRAPGRAESIRLVAGDRLSSEGQRITLDQATGAASTAPSSAAPGHEASPPPEPESSMAPVTSPSTSASPTADDWRTLYRTGKYAIALARVRQLDLRRLTRSADAPTLADLADTARLGGDPALGASTLVTLERRFPGSREARPARFLLGRIYAAQGRQEAATLAFEQYLTGGLGGRYEVEAMGRLMSLYQANGATQKAEAMARRYLARAPDGPYRELAVSLLK